MEKPRIFCTNNRSPEKPTVFQNLCRLFHFIASATIGIAMVTIILKAVCTRLGYSSFHPYCSSWSITPSLAILLRSRRSVFFACLSAAALCARTYSLTYQLHLDANSAATYGDGHFQEETQQFASSTVGGSVEATVPNVFQNGLAGATASISVAMPGPDQWIFTGNATARGIDAGIFAWSQANAWVDITIPAGKYFYLSDGSLDALHGWGSATFKQTHNAGSPDFGSERNLTPPDQLFYDVPPEVDILSPGTYRLAISAYCWHVLDPDASIAASFTLKLAPVPASDSGETAFLLAGALAVIGGSTISRHRKEAFRANVPGQSL